MSQICIWIEIKSLKFRIRFQPATSPLSVLWLHKTFFNLLKSEFFREFQFASLRDELTDTFTIASQSPRIEWRKKSLIIFSFFHDFFYHQWPVIKIKASRRDFFAVNIFFSWMKSCFLNLSRLYWPITAFSPINWLINVSRRSMASEAALAWSPLSDADSTQRQGFIIHIQLKILIPIALIKCKNSTVSSDSR